MIKKLRRLLALGVLLAAPHPGEKSDSQIAQEYRNWYYGVRAEFMGDRK